MSKPWRKKPDKGAARRQLKMLENQLTPEQRAKMKCGAQGCDADGIAAHECVTCAALVEESNRTHGRLRELFKQGKHKEIYVAFSCGDLKHREAVLRKVRKHAVTKHPANLLRVIGAGLAGEEI
jgi:hypothetical protein